MKHLIKNLLAHVLYYSGLLHLYKHWRLRNRAVVLTYHRVLEAEERRRSYSHDAIIVDTQTFERHLRFLRKAFRLLSLEEFSRHLRERRPFSGAACLITFDDGWLDNYRNAFPLLKRHGAPATIFLPVDYIGTGKQFWQERLARMLHWLHAHRASYPREVLERYELAELDAADSGQLRERIRAYVSRQKAKPAAEIEQLLERLNADVSARIDGDVDAFLDWQQVKMMARDGVAFGSHSVSHRILTGLSEPEIEHELARSRSKLEEVFAAPVQSVAYPNGNVDDRVAATAAAQGYQIGFTTRHGFVSATDAPLALNRVNIHDAVTHNTPMFFCRILGLL